MFGLGMGELLVIALVALLFIGPEKLPGAAKSLGKGIRELRRNTRDLRDAIEKDTDLGDAVREIRSALNDDGRYIPPRPVAASQPRPADPPPPSAKPDASNGSDDSEPA